MNTNRQKNHVKNDGIVRSCVKHCKTLAKSIDKINKPHTHTPSIRCHEEVICKSSSHIKPDYFTCQLDGHSGKGDTKSIKESKSKGNMIRCSKSPSLKNKIDYESTNEKVYADNKDLFHQSMKSKSEPFRKPNLEDSVDFIPVKLSNKNNNFTKVSQKHNPKSVCSDNLKNNRGPTWDQLLKGASQSVVKNKIESQIIYRNDKSNYHPSDNPQDTSKKKMYPSNSKGFKSKDDTILKPKYKISNSPKSEETNNKSHISNPAKTLDTLIEKLREKILKQPQNDNLNKIIVDMENALRKISFEDEEKTTESDICSSDKSSVPSSSKSPQTSDTKHSNIEEVDVISLKKNLEESCLFLQSLCIKQRENCTNHIREKEQLSIQLAESRRLLAVAKSREKDYEKTIGELRLKLQETISVKEHQYQSIQDLQERVVKLKYENETLGSINARFKECSAEKELLQSKLYIKDLEIEKLKVLLEVKQSWNPISKNFSDKKFGGENIEDDLKLDIPNHDKGNIFSSLSETSLTLSKPRIICSSQASSSPRRSPSPYESWQHISSIPQDLTEINDLRNSMVRVFNIMKSDTEWSDSLELDLEEPLVPFFSSEDDDELKPKDVKLCHGSVETLSS